MAQSISQDPKVYTDLVSNAAEHGIDPNHVKEIEGADEVLRYASISSIEIDDATNRQILRKIDLNIMPWLMGLYVLQYLDKGVLSYAGVMGIQEEMHMSSSEYNWLGSVYYVGYIVAVPLHNRGMQRFPPSKWIATCMTLWGIVLSTMAACHNWPALMIQRTFLGSLEASVNCGFMLITAAWFQKHEQATRTGAWSACVGIATIIGGIIAFGCVAGFETHPNASFTSWKILALCTGLISVIYGLCMWKFMATSVVTAKFFSADERTIAVERLRENHAGVGTTVYKRYQAKEAWTDYRTWMYVAFVLSSQIPSAGLTLLSSILIKSLGFNTRTTLLLALPTGAILILSNFSFGLLADKTKQRSWSAISVNLISIFAVSLLVGLSSISPLYKKSGQLVAYFLMMGTSATSWFLVISMMSSNVLGYTKKTSSNGIVFAAQGVAYFVGPQIFRDPPYYHRAKAATIGLWSLATVILLAFYLLNAWENKKREREIYVGERQRGIEFMDLTDKENKLFRYVV